MSDDDDVYFVIDPKEYQKLQEMVVALQGEKQELTNRIKQEQDKLKFKDQEIGKFFKDLRDQKTKCILQLYLVTDCKQQLDESLKRNGLLIQKLEQTENERIQIEKNLQKRVKELNDHILKENDQQQEYKLKLDELNIQILNQRNQLESIIQSREDEIKNKENLIKQLEAQLNKTYNEFEIMNQSQVSLINQGNDYKQKIRQLEEEQQQNQVLKKRLELVDDELSHVKKELKQQEEKVSKMNNLIQLFKQTISESDKKMSKKNSQLEEIGEEKIVLMQQTSRLSSQIESLMNDRQRDMQQIQQLRKKIEQLEKKIESGKHELVQAWRDKQQITEKLQSLQLENERLIQQAKQDTSKINKQNSQIEEKQALPNNRETRMQTQRNQFKLLENQVKNLEQDLNSANEKLKELTQGIIKYDKQVTFAIFFNNFQILFQQILMTGHYQTMMRMTSQECPYYPRYLTQSAISTLIQRIPNHQQNLSLPQLLVMENDNLFIYFNLLMFVLTLERNFLNRQQYQIIKKIQDYQNVELNLSQLRYLLLSQELLQQLQCLDWGTDINPKLQSQ